MGSPGSLSELNVLDMTLSLLWPVITVCTTCSICKEYNFIAVFTRRHESVVWGVVVGVERGEVLGLWLDGSLASRSQIPGLWTNATFRLQQAQLAGTCDCFGAP